MKKRTGKILILLLVATAFITSILCGCMGTNASSSYDWIIKTISKNYYEDIPEDVLHKSGMEGGLSSVLDIYSAYYTKEEYAQIAASNSGSRSGVGITCLLYPSDAADDL